MVLNLDGPDAAEVLYGTNTTQEDIVCNMRKWDKDESNSAEPGHCPILLNSLRVRQLYDDCVGMISSPNEPRPPD